MQRYFDQIDALNDIGAVLRFAKEVSLSQGVLRMSYHVTPLFNEPLSMPAAVYAAGYSEDWLALYEQEGFDRSNPIPQRVLESGGMMSWEEAENAGENTPDNQAYFDALREHGLIHGFGIPLFGPRGRDAYASFDFGRELQLEDDEALGIVRSVAQAGHQRICRLLDEASEVPALSEREIEVLNWTARGKSISAIAAILDLSPDTVKTYAKRIYSKLEVSDRVGAVVKGLKLGLVDV